MPEYSHLTCFNFDSPDGQRFKMKIEAFFVTQAFRVHNPESRHLSHIFLNEATKILKYTTEADNKWNVEHNAAAGSLIVIQGNITGYYRLKKEMPKPFSVDKVDIWIINLERKENFQVDQLELYFKQKYGSPMNYCDKTKDSIQLRLNVSSKKWGFLQQNHILSSYVRMDRNYVSKYALFVRGKVLTLVNSPSDYVYIDVSKFSNQEKRNIIAYLQSFMLCAGKLDDAANYIFIRADLLHACGYVVKHFNVNDYQEVFVQVNSKENKIELFEIKPKEIRVVTEYPGLEKMTNLCCEITMPSNDGKPFDLLLIKPEPPEIDYFYINIQSLSQEFKEKIWNYLKETANFKPIGGLSQNDKFIYFHIGNRSYASIVSKNLLIFPNDVQKVKVIFKNGKVDRFEKTSPLSEAHAFEYTFDPSVKLEILCGCSDVGKSTLIKNNYDSDITFQYKWIREQEKFHEKIRQTLIENLLQEVRQSEHITYNIDVLYPHKLSSKFFFDIQSAIDKIKNRGKSAYPATIYYKTDIGFIQDLLLTPGRLNNSSFITRVSPFSKVNPINTDVVGKNASKLLPTKIFKQSEIDEVHNFEISLKIVKLINYLKTTNFRFRRTYSMFDYETIEYHFNEYYDELPTLRNIQNSNYVIRVTSVDGRNFNATLVKNRYGNTGMTVPFTSSLTSCNTI
jgi:hypothetical protein